MPQKLREKGANERREKSAPEGNRAKADGKVALQQQREAGRFAGRRKIFLPRLP